jgi:hypothetical protein
VALLSCVVVIERGCVSVHAAAGPGPLTGEIHRPARWGSRDGHPGERLEKRDVLRFWLISQFGIPRYL